MVSTKKNIQIEASCAELISQDKQFNNSFHLQVQWNSVILISQVHKQRAGQLG